MSIFIFLKKNNNQKINKSSQYTKALEYNSKIKDLLNQEKYLAKSDYLKLLEQYKNIYDFFNTMVQGDMLNIYCKSNKVNKKNINNFLFNYKDI